MYISNTWYIAAEPQELGERPLARTFLGKPVVLFKTQSGRIAALDDRCPHRFAPLSLGRVIGEHLRCGYHGAEFDCAGACVAVPGQSIVPPKAKITSYPLVQKHGYIWIWLGDPREAADHSTIPDFLYRSDHPGWDGGYGHFESIRANFNLINDNLFDITHAEYVHPESFGGEEMRIYRNAKPGTEYVDGQMTWVSTERGIVFRMRSLNMQSGGPFYRWMVATSLGRDSYPDPIDLDMEVSWAAPSFTSFLLNSRPAGKPREAGAEVCNMHAITPETESSSHYFYRSVKNYGDSSLAAVFVAGVKAIFDQDKPLLEAQQGRVGAVDLFSQQPVSFGGDMLQQRARKINRTLLERENQG
ncbi:MAG: aromatic ring-hydroxylating dioxygenase subunit alpha [Proteobacteria bacterium]|nr:aromatic ring-hydroxylating dioxygenase subunit alpha [Pseudomonadota bacterium]